MPSRQTFLTAVEGGSELAALFEELPKSLTDKVLKDTATKALQPVLDAAKTTVLHQSLFRGDLLNSLQISTKLSARQKRQSGAKRGDVIVYAGAAGPRGAHAHLVEFGTGPRYQKKTGKYVGVMRAEPFMRPAWDTNGDKVLQIMRDQIWDTLKKAVQRLRKTTERGKLSAKNTAFFAR